MSTYQTERYIHRQIVNGGSSTEATYSTTRYESVSPLIKVKIDSDGFRAMTPYSRSEGRVNSYFPIIGQMTIYYRPYGLRLENLNGPPAQIHVGSASVFTDEELNSLKIRALNKVKDQKVNLAMMYKDRVKTASGILDRLQSILGFVRDVKRGELVKAARRMKRFWRSRTPGIINKYRAVNQKVGKPLARMWLELNFLHMQAYADVKGLFEEFSKDTSLPFIHGRAAISDQRELLVVGGTYSWNWVGIWNQSLPVKEVKYVQLSYKVDNAFLKRASSVGLTNVPYLLWDATPLSFIIDWVLPLGNYFQTFDATVGLVFKGGMKGHVYSVNGTVAVGAPPGYVVLGGGLVIPVKHRSFTRALIDDKVELPGFRNPLSGVAWKIATVAALVANAVKSSQRKPR